MTCREQASAIYKLCVASAKKKQTLRYGEVLDALGYPKNVPGHVIRYGLELLLIACAHLGLPILASLVVNASTGSPSPPPPGKSWDDEINKSFAHDNWPPVDEIDWDHFWRHRRELSAKYGTPGYWNNER